MSDASFRPPRPTGLRRLGPAIRNSLNGLRAAARDEASVRQEMVACVVALPLALWLGRSGVERALLFGSVLLVLIVELLNTAIEVAVDRIGLEHHPLSGQAKDIGSAAVFASLLLAAATWLFILSDRIQT